MKKKVIIKRTVVVIFILISVFAVIYLRNNNDINICPEEQIMERETSIESEVSHVYSDNNSLDSDSIQQDYPEEQISDRKTPEKVTTEHEYVE